MAVSSRSRMPSLHSVVFLKKFPFLSHFYCFLFVNLSISREITNKKCGVFKGVKSVEINRKQQKVTVTGYVEASKVLKKAKSTGKKAEIWPYVPYSLVAQPYIAQAYDKKAPPGYVRNVEQTAITASVTKYEDPYMNMFSDDNPNACSIM